MKTKNWFTFLVHTFQKKTLLAKPLHLSKTIRSP